MKGDFRLNKEIIHSVSQHHFFLKDGYTSRSQPDYFHDLNEEKDRVWQPQVYAIANFLGKKLNCRYIIDIGCGNASKLVKLYPSYEIIGIDFNDNLAFCEKSYPFGTWIEHDLESEQLLEIPNEILKNSVVICADVIEHLINPGFLLWKLKLLMEQAPVCLLSTPERDVTRGLADFGPPDNPHHVREWNSQELGEMLTFAGLNVLFSGLTISDNFLQEKKTVLKIIGNNTLKHPATNLVQCEEVINEINQLL